jgi:hypothetical protein
VAAYRITYVTDKVDSVRPSRYVGDMKRHRISVSVRQPIALKLESIRIITAGTDGQIEVPPQTNGSTASSCQTSRFNCC